MARGGPPPAQEPAPSPNTLQSSTANTLQSGQTQETLDRSNDPRFQKRVPESFYEEEQKKFKPLPSHWETSTFKGRTYFVNHRNKTTSWIDPRTKKTRKLELDKVEVGELPYGWEELVDDDFGVYYVNHIIQSNYPDPPWDPKIREQAAELQAFVQQQIMDSERELAELERKEQEKIKAAQKRVEELEAEKHRIEKELLALRQQALEEAEQTESEVSDSSSVSSFSSTATESELLQSLREIEDELKRTEPKSVPQSKEEFQRRLQELIELNKRLTQDGPGYDGVAEYKKTEEELNSVAAMLEKEANARHALEQEIINLKGEMEKMYNDEGGEYDDDEEEQQEIEIEEDLVGEILPPLPPPQLTRRTKYEMEVELLMLKKKLQAEKLERERLGKLKEGIQSAEQETGKMPVWIKQINEVAASSKTLRVKIGQKAASNPDALSFRERMLFFAAGKDGKK